MLCTTRWLKTIRQATGEPARCSCRCSSAHKQHNPSEAAPLVTPSYPTLVMHIVKKDAIDGVDFGLPCHLLNGTFKSAGCKYRQQL